MKKDMRKFTVINSWSEEVLYSMQQTVEAESFEDALKIASSLENIALWSDPERVDTLGDGAEFYFLVTDIGSDETKQYGKIAD